VYLALILRLAKKRKLYSEQTDVKKGAPANPYTTKLLLLIMFFPLYLITLICGILSLLSLLSVNSMVIEAIRINIWIIGIVISVVTFVLSVALIASKN